MKNANIRIKDRGVLKSVSIRELSHLPIVITHGYIKWYTFATQRT